MKSQFGLTELYQGEDPVVEYGSHYSRVLNLRY